MHGCHSPNILRLSEIVELFEQTLPDFLPDRFEVDVSEQGYQVPQQGLEILQVRPGHPLGARVLDLDGNLSAVLQYATVNLAD